MDEAKVGSEKKMEAQEERERDVAGVYETFPPGPCFSHKTGLGNTEWTYTLT